MRFLYLDMALGVQTHSFTGSLANPQAQGFMAATSMKLAGKVMVPWDATDCHDLVFQGLPQHLQNGMAELWQLVQEQDSPVAQGYLPGPGQAAAADKAGVGDGVVGRSKGPLGDEGRRRR